MTNDDRRPSPTPGVRRATRAFGLVGLVIFGVALFFVLYLTEAGTTARGISVAGVALGGLLIIVYLATNVEDVRTFFTSRQFVYGGNVVVMVVLFAGVVVFINLIGAKFYSTADWTRKGTFTLSSKTETLVASLDEDLQVVTFWSETDWPERRQYPRLQDLLRRYRDLSDKIRVKFVDLRDQAEVELQAAKYDVGERNVVVLEYKGKRKILHSYDLFTTSGMPYPGAPPPKEEFKGEDALTSAIQGLVEEEPPVIMFTTGFGEPGIDQAREPSGFSRIARVIRDSNMTLDTLPMFGLTAVPDTCDTLVVAMPTRTYSEAAVGAIGDFLDRGGRAVFLLEPALDQGAGDPRFAMTGFEDLMASYGIAIRNDLVVDPARRMLLTGPFVFFARGESYYPHPITDAVEGTTTEWQSVRSLDQGQAGPPQYQVMPLVTTSDRAWGETDLRTYLSTGRVRPDEGEDAAGPLTIALAVSSRPPPAMPGQPPPAGQDQPLFVVVGDGHFVSNGAVSPSNANRDLFVNALRWLTGRTASMGIEPKEVDEAFFTVTGPHSAYVKIIVFGMAGLAVVIGVVVWIVRR